MRVALAALASCLALSAAPADAAPDPPRGHVSRAEYRKVEIGMSRAQVERIVDAGRGCLYRKYELDGVLYTGRQYGTGYRSAMAVAFAAGADGVARVESKLRGAVDGCAEPRSAVTSPERTGP